MVNNELLPSLPRALIADAGFGEFRAQYFHRVEALILHLEQMRAYSDFPEPPAPPRLSYVPFRIAYTPLLSEYPLIFDMAREVGNCTLILEEADRFENPRDVPEYDEIVTRGRHFGVSIMAVAVHIYKIPPDLRRQATRIIAFSQILPTDLDALAEVVGPTAYRIGPDESGRPQLPDFARLDWSKKTGSRLLDAKGRPLMVPAAPVVPLGPKAHAPIDLDPPPVVS